MRVLGIDPGTAVVGWGVVDQRANRPSHRASGVVRPRGELPQRLAEIHRRIAALVDEHTPTCVALERAFVGANVQSAFRIGEARGAILSVAGERKLSVFECTPAQVKLAVAGAGRASKEQMKWMVTRILDVPATLLADQADALAIALCHLQSHALGAVAGARRVRSGRGADRQAWERLAAKA